MATNSTSPPLSHPHRLLPPTASTGITVRYATLSDYFAALAADKSVQWPATYTSDFFPYADEPTQYWTGYYASRSKFKGIVRRASALLRTAEMLYMLSWGGKASVCVGMQLSWQRDNPRASLFVHTAGGHFDGIEALRHACGEIQHHDAITGVSPHDCSTLAFTERGGGVRHRHHDGSCLGHVQGQRDQRKLCSWSDN